MCEAINKIVRTSRQMLQKIGREPTPGELGEKLGMLLAKARQVLKIVKEPLSFETPIGDEEDSHLGDFLEDKNAILPIDAAIQSSLRESLSATAPTRSWSAPTRSSSAVGSSSPRWRRAMGFPPSITGANMSKPAV